ncbi:hypothetical protein LHJ74_20900 [Streptomyces sp. N2-109]|uniref:Integral membrane protein n=1 Tax=Streptomyces gossypii TaxID=2883101 RepID=A0ABT2JWQ8_9ACTN|nr:hypothetical protein [Streptomyces gossypii]MCT2592332.1 hypothetical protein [Streptomyces gossypii]
MTRHPFEPARLLFGLLLLAAGVLYVLDAVGEADVNTVFLLALVPAALVVGTLASVTTFAVRRGLARRRGLREQGDQVGHGEHGGQGPEGREAPAPDGGERQLPDLPFDELRLGYRRSRDTP